MLETCSLFFLDNPNLFRSSLYFPFRHLEAHQQMDRKQIFRTFRQVEYSVELVCSVCDERFSNRSTLSDHMMSRHTLEIFQCGVCIESYNSEVTLKKHIERVHGPIDSHNTLLQKVVSSSGANVNDFCDKRDDTASAAVTNGSAAVETEDSDLSNIAGGHRTRQALKRKSEGTKRTRSANWKKVKVSVKENATCGEGSPSGVKLEPKDIHQGEQRSFKISISFFGRRTELSSSGVACRFLSLFLSFFLSFCFIPSSCRE